MDFHYEQFEQKYAKKTLFVKLCIYIFPREIFKVRIYSLLTMYNECVTYTR